VKAGLKAVHHGRSAEKGDPMLGIIALVLLILWAMGFLAFHVTSGFIHLLVFHRLLELEASVGTNEERLALEDTLQSLRLLRNYDYHFRL
jgi:hypothetical protein